MIHSWHTSQFSSETIRRRCQALFLSMAAALASFSSATTFAQSAAPPQKDTITIEGTVRNSAGEAVAGASVVLEEKDSPTPTETKTNVDGTFVFSADRAGTYTVKADKSGVGNAVAASLILSAGEKGHLDLVLTLHPAAGTMEFEDKPNFTVAGVTDYSTLGLHGSDTSSRTSDALAKETLALKSGGSTESSPRYARESEGNLRAAVAQAPGSFEANHQLGEFYSAAERYREAIPPLEGAYRINPENQANAYSLALAYEGNGDFPSAREQIRKMLANGADGAEVHHLSGDLDERAGDPLRAVHEYEKAARLDPSERNYFDWGAELLLHKAALPAVEVFTKGSGAHPDSARMLAGLGAALYATGSYDDAARRLCDASDLKPAEPAPYFFLGQIEKATPAPLPCSEQKLARFAHDQPGNALANYYYALALWKRARESENAEAVKQAEALLEEAVKIDPNLGEAYVQLGILFSERNDLQHAVAAYQKALEVNPHLGEAHYRLSLAFKRMGEESKAAQELQAYKRVEKTEAAAVEQQRKQLRQFLVILKDQPATASPH
jgi:tetratricopeptide (TPR) repeat protein